MRQTKAELQDACRSLRRELSRFRVDAGQVQLSFTHGMVTLQGQVRPLRGHESIFLAEVETVLKALRSQPMVRDVVVEWRLVY